MQDKMKLALTAVEIVHLLSHLENNRIDLDYENAWYYGRRDQFLKRHVGLINKLREIKGEGDAGKI
jgi:hypothetical protein